MTGTLLRIQQRIEKPCYSFPALPVRQIPHTAPWITDREIDSVKVFLKGGNIGSSRETLRPAEEALRNFTDGHPVLLTTSCTAAMELALRCLDISPGDEVIVPSFTFVSTANAVLQCGGTPVLTDIDDRTLCLDIASLEAACTKRTRAVLPVHYGGISCDMDALSEIAGSRGMHVIEDAAHALGARYKGRPLGTLGSLGCFSFHDTKNCVSGEGGALVINDPKLTGRAEMIYEKGTNRSQFLRGEIDKYTWVCQGSSYTMSAVLATILAVQISRYEEILRGRRRVSRLYREGLSSLVREGHIRFTEVPEYSTPNEHLAFFLVRDTARRDKLLEYLQTRGIQAYFHYIPLHLSPYAMKRLGTRPGQFPVAEQISLSIVRLPLFPQMPDDDCAYVIECVKQFFHPERAVNVPSENGLRSSPKPEIEPPDLSLVIPCYQEEGHLKNNLDEILKTLDETPFRYEVILVDDASRDGTAKVIRQYLENHPHHRLRAIFHEKNMGRGAAVRDGLEAASGRFAGFIDIDLEIHARYLPAALKRLVSGEADMVIADRHYPFRLPTLSRYITTRGYRFLVRTLLGTPAFDTESGFKFFRLERIIPLLKEVKDQRWFWDTEVTVRSHDAGLKISVIPVVFIRNADKKSTVRLLGDGVRSLFCLVRFMRERHHPHRRPNGPNILNYKA